MCTISISLGLNDLGRDHGRNQGSSTHSRTRGLGPTTTSEAELQLSSGSTAGRTRLDQATARMQPSSASRVRRIERPPGREERIISSKCTCSTVSRREAYTHQAASITLRSSPTGTHRQAVPSQRTSCTVPSSGRTPYETSRVGAV